MRYTFDDFKRAAEGKGLYHQFSEHDLNLARNNPNAGMSILSYKQDYQNAPTAQARALANAGAERVRSSYGNYSAGVSGDQYYLQQPRPISFSMPTAPTYENRYDDRIQKLLKEMENRPEFSYHAETDDLYSQYRKQYTREGQRATADALGTAAAATGGIPSSYAVTAASQAGDYYASKMTDKIPELYQAAYDRYLNEYRQKANMLSAYQSAEQSDYNKFLTSLNQHNTDRNFHYGQYLDDIAQQKSDESQKWQKALQAAEMGDYKLLNDLGIRTENHPAEFEKKYTLARLAASMGDYRPSKELGIDTSKADYFLAPRSTGGSYRSSGNSLSQQLAFAKTAAEYGDFSYLDAMGIDTSAMKYGEAPEEETAQIAAAKERADQNGKIVKTKEDWDLLLNEYTEEELRAKGYRYLEEKQKFMPALPVPKGADDYIKILLGR